MDAYARPDRNLRRGCPPVGVMYRFPDIYILAAISARHLIKIRFVRIGRARVKLIHHEGTRKRKLGHLVDALRRIFHSERVDGRFP